MGLGDYDPSKTEVIGGLKPSPHFKLPPLGGEAIAGNKDVQALITSRMMVRPEADPELSTGCGTCVDHCPMSAFSMSGTIPVVDRESCITCFCCQEMCPEQAMALK